jgi:hypothetical protein
MQQSGDFCNQRLSSVSSSTTGQGTCCSSLPSGISTSSSTPDMSSAELILPVDEYVPVFPYSSHVSSRICLKSALSIAQAFDALPHPLVDPLQAVRSRTMPSFACCAMQSAYALLMVHNKTWFMQVGDVYKDKPVHSLLLQCQQGLRSVLAALDDYCVAFEAIRGMRGTSIFSWGCDQSR